MTLQTCALEGCDNTFTPVAVGTHSEKKYCCREHTKKSARGRWRGVAGEERTFIQTMRLAVQRAQSNKKGGPTSRDKPGDLTLSFVDEGARCHYTGLKLADVYDTDNPLTWPSVERVDNDRGYDMDNCVWAMRGLNYLRNRYTQDNMYDFLDLVEGVAAERRKAE